MFVTSWINPIDLGNIQPYHPLATITRVSTIERYRIHNLARDINNIIMVINSTGRNTIYPITNTNSPRYHISEGYNCSTWLWWFYSDKFSRMGASSIHLTWPSHNSPSQKGPILYLINTTPQLQVGHPCLQDS